MRNRKHLFFCIFMLIWPILSTTTIFAQCPTDTLFWVDFQTQQLPALWLNLDRDSLNDQANRPAAWFIQEDPLSSGPAGTNLVAASNSWFTPAGQADNWLITDPVVICDSNLYLIWKSAPFEGPVYRDGYEVLLSTAGPDPDSFQVVLETFSEGIDATAQGSPGTVHSAYNGNRGLLQGWRSSLKPWLGDTIHLAFRHTSTNDNLIQLDDIGVVRIPTYDATVTQVTYDSEYTVTPRTQVQAMTFSAEVMNTGIDSLSRVNVALAGSRDGTPVFLANDSVPGLAPLASAMVSTATAYTPAQPGEYRVTASVTSMPTDAFPANDTLSTSFMVDDSVYARDNGVAFGSRNLGPQAGFMGHTFRLVAADTLTSISFYLEAVAGMDTVYGAVYQFGAAPGALLARTDPWPVTGSFPRWVHLGLEGIDLPLNAGLILVGVEETATGLLDLGVSREKVSPGVGWHRVGNAWAATDALDLDGTYMVRANFGEVDELVATPRVWGTQDLRVFPNPGTGVFRLEFVRPLPRATTLRVLDLRGQVVQRRDLPGGISFQELDLRQQAAGMYLLSLDGLVVSRLTLRP